MIVRFGMAPRRRGLTVEQFKHHWRTTHASAAAQIPNIVVVARLADQDQALAHHRSPARSNADRELAGLFFGRADLCAQVVRVVSRTGQFKKFSG